MYSPVVRGCILAVLALAATSAMRAQCPDGTPPPCRRPAAPVAPRAVDENLIAIFPFRITGVSPEAAALREGAMDLLALALDEQAGLRVVSSRTLLARARNFSDASSVADAAAIARSLGAGTMILGTAVVVGTQIRASAGLHDLVRNRPTVTIEARGLLADPAPVVDSLAFALARLRLTSTGGIVRRPLAEFASTSPPALRLYLAGERLARRGLWQESADSLLAALTVDSTFALAMYRLRVVNSFGATITPWTAISAMERALRSIARLPRRQGDLLQAAYAQVEGDAAASITKAEALASRYPDDAEAAYEEGEAFYHLGLAFGTTPQRALEPFERAIRLDSTLIDPYNHAVELRMATGDSAGALALARRAAALAPQSGVHQAVLLALRAIVLRESPGALAGEAARLTVNGTIDIPERAGYEVVRALGHTDPHRALSLDEAFLVAGSTPDQPVGRRIANLGRLAAVHLAQGKPAEARSDLATMEQLQPGTPFAARTRLLAALTDGVNVEASASELRRIAPQPGLQTLGLLGLAAVRLSRPAVVDSVVAAAESIARLEPVTELQVRALVGTIRGLEALSRSDTSVALRRLSEAFGILPYGVSGTFRAEDASQFGLLALAEVEHARGQHAQALSRLDYFAFATGVVPLRGRADALRMAINARLRP